MPRLQRILLVDDNRVSQRVVEALLQSLGLDVDIRCNGQQAVEACLGFPYDAVLMDGFMPLMDGFEAAREIRRLERGRRTPIIAITAGHGGESSQRCMAAGMDGFLPKPVSRERLAAGLGRWLPGLRGVEAAPEPIVVPGIHG